MGYSDSIYWNFFHPAIGILLTMIIGFAMAEYFGVIAGIVFATLTTFTMIRISVKRNVV